MNDLSATIAAIESTMRPMTPDERSAVSAFFASHFPDVPSAFQRLPDEQRLPTAAEYAAIETVLRGDGEQLETELTEKAQHHINLQLDAEAECVTLHALLADVVRALSGGAVSPDASLDLLRSIPSEVSHVVRGLRQDLVQMTAERDAALQLTEALTEQVKVRGEMRDEAIEHMNLATQRVERAEAACAEMREALRGARSLVQQLVEALTAKRWPRKITMTEQHAEDLTDAALDAARPYLEAAE